MKKLKQRIKRALAGFLKDELLDYIGYKEDRPQMITKENVFFRMEAELMRMDFSIDIHDVKHFDQQRAYEEAIDSAKKKMFDEVYKNIIVDSRNMTSPEYAWRREISLALYIGKIKN